MAHLAHDPLAHTSLTFRRVRGAAYAAMVLCGLFLPFQVIGQVARPVVWLTVCAFLVVGGTVCAVGQLSGRWVGEYVGLPLVTTALAGFGALQLTVGGWVAVPSVALLWSFTGITYSRWRDVSAVFSAARRMR